MKLGVRGSFVGMVALALAFAGCAATSESTDEIDEDPSEPVDNAVSGPVSFTQNQFGVTFSNDDGQWVIYTGCFGPKVRGGQNLTVGPGYIARVIARATMPTGSKVVLDAEQPLTDEKGNFNGLSAPGFSGLGAFGWHHARPVAPNTLDPNHAWEITGRFCAEDHGGFGVSGAQVIDGPRIASDGAGALAIDVNFTDAYSQGTPIMRVRYVYRVYASVIKMWASVTQHCNNGDCGVNAPGPAFIKEPKFVSSVNAGGYKRTVIFNDKGEVATNSNSSNGSCVWAGNDPTKSTGQCDGNGRARARFDFGDLSSGTDGKCDATSQLCLNTVMRAYPADADGGVTPGKAGKPWEGSGIGFDRWAELAATRPFLAATDSNQGGATWGCYQNPSTPQNRRWELVAWHKDAQGRLGAAQFGFHAWEGGTGAYDCEPLSRRFGPEGETFAVFAQYSLNAGWAIE